MVLPRYYHSNQKHIHTQTGEVITPKMKWQINGRLVLKNRQNHGRMTIRPRNSEEGGVPPSSAYGGLIGHDLGGHLAIILTDFDDNPSADFQLQFWGSFLL